MKGSEIIKLIKENDLEDYEVSFIFTDGYAKDASGGFPDIRRFRVTGIADIGVSSREFYLDGDEECK